MNDTGAPRDYPYRWFWRTWPKAQSWDDRDLRKGQRCRALAFGAAHSVLVEFEDGTRMVSLRYGLRRIDPPA